MPESQIKSTSLNSFTCCVPVSCSFCNKFKSLFVPHKDYSIFFLYFFYFSLLFLLFLLLYKFYIWNQFCCCCFFSQFLASLFSFRTVVMHQNVHKLYQNVKIIYRFAHNHLQNKIDENWKLSNWPGNKWALQNELNETKLN